MSDFQHSQKKEQSWWSKTFDRSIYSLIFGNNLADKNVAATVISIMLVATLCWLALSTDGQLQITLISSLANLVFGVVGYYFGSRRHKSDEGHDD